MAAAPDKSSQLEDLSQGLSSNEPPASQLPNSPASQYPGEDHNLLRAALDAIPDAVFVKDFEGRYRMINSAGARFIGKPVEEIIGQDDSALFSPESARDIIRRDREIMQTRKPQTFEEDSTANGVTVTYLATKDVYCDAEGKVIGLIGIARDVTERKRAEKARREAERKYRDIFENAGEGIFQATPAGQFIAANPAMARMHGFASPEEFIKGRNGAGRLSLELTRLLKAQAVVSGFEQQVPRKDGSEIWISLNARAVKDAQGEDWYYEGTVQDITDRKRAEDSLRESEERYRELFENAKDAIYVHDLSGKYLSVNRAAEKLIGYPRQAILGKNFADFFSAEQLQQVRESFCRKLTEHGETTYETEVTARDGRSVPVEISSRLIYENGSVKGVQGMARDITERKRAEDALRKTEQEQRELAQRLEVERARLAEAQAVAKVGSWELDLRNNILTWSDETYRIFEMDRTKFEASYEAFLERVHPEDRATVDRAYTESIASHQSYAIDHRMPMENGSTKIVHERCRHYYAEDGTPIRSVGTCQDITHLKQAEEALRESEERFSKAFHSSPAALSIALLDGGTLLEVNDSFLRETGYERDEVIGRTTCDIGLWADPEFRRTMTGLLREQGRAADLEFKYRRKSGEIRDGLLSVDLIELSGNPCVLGIGQDITERKRGEEQLKMREAQLMDAQSLAHIGSWEWDIAADRVTWSDELYRIWRVKPEEFAGTYEDVLRRVHPDDRERFKSAVETAYREHRPYSFEHRMLRADGTIGFLHARGTVVLDENQNPIRMFGTGQDITELKRAEDEIKATNDQLRALSASLRSAREEEGARIARELHDELGSALTSLNWDLEEIDRSLERGGQTGISSVREKISGMSTLVDSTINTIRRISSELRPSILDDLGLMEAIEWQAQQFQLRTGIAYHGDCSLDNVNLNREQSTAVFRIFQEALTNILRHAEATRFAVAISREDGNFVLTVSDNGRGINANEISGPQSLGLLGMSERAHLIGGTVSIAGIGGHGTAVRVRVPMAQASIPAPAQLLAESGIAVS
ncbi:MAG: PAS domain S-box protein [Pyrinomonadaceae bacterium]